MSDVTLKLLLLGEDRASKAFKGAGDAASESGSKMKRNYAAGVMVAATAVAGFAKLSVDKFKEVGAETLGLMRTMGGSAETASRLRFAASQTGISYETLSKSTGKFAKLLAASGPIHKTISVRVKENADGLTVLSDSYTKNSAGLSVHTRKLRDVHNGMQTLTTQIKTGDGAWKTTALTVSKASDKFVTIKKNIELANPLIAQLGIKVRDAHGHILPMATILPDLAEKFKKMPGGAEKTALAMKLFGKSGADMLPFLNKGKEGLAELSKESDKYGLTLTGKNLDALKKSKASQREWNASLDGLRVQFGAQILPLLNTFVGFIRDKVIPIVTKVTGFLQKHAGVAKILGIVLGTLIVGLKALAIAQGLVNTVMAMNPIGLVVIGVAALAAGLIYAYKHSETFRKIVQTAFHVVAAAVDWCRDHWKLLISLILGPFGVAIALVATHFTAIKTVAMGAIRFVVDTFLGMVSVIIHGAASAFGWVPGLGGKLKGAARAFDTFRDDVNRALGGTQKSLTVKARVEGYQNVTGQLNAIAQQVGYIQANASSITIGTHPGRPIAMRASGGPVTAGLPYIVGEHRPELFVPSQNGRIIPRVPGGGGGTHLTVHVNGQVYGSVTQLAGVVLDGLQQLKGRGVHLGLI